MDQSSLLGTDPGRAEYEELLRPAVAAQGQRERERERERDSALEMYFLFSLPIPIMELRLDRLNEGNEPNTRTAVLFAFRTVV